MAARVFLWIASGGGAWAIAANWDDLTDGVSPSVAVPGSLDSVTVVGPSGASVYALTGNASLAAAALTGDIILSGNVTATTLTAGSATAGGLLQLAAGASLSSSAATLSGGSLLVNGINTALNVAGQIGLGTTQTAGNYGVAAQLNVTAGGHAQSLGILLRTANSGIYVDPASIMENGTLTTGIKGALTNDTGYLIAGQGNANEYGTLVNNGTVYSFGGTLSVGAVSGYGHLVIAANSALLLSGACGAHEQVQFSGANTTLDVVAEAYAPQGTITGFAAGDAIDFRGSLISTAVYNPTANGLGVLSLYYGTQVAAQLTLLGDYSTSTFLTAGDGANGTLINVAAAISGTGTASAGTATPDQYLWTATGSGAWGSAANWQDQTTGATPAAIAPGIHDNVAIAASQTGFTVIAGPANASSLAITGEVALTGTYSIGTLAIGAVAGTSFTDGGLDLLAGTVIKANAGTLASGAISAAGAGAALSLNGTLTMGGGQTGVGLPVTALTATAGGRIRAAGLVIGGGSGNSITTDPAGAVEFGTLGGAAAGAVTVDAGASITGNGSINPLGPVVDNGSITATGGVLTLGAVTGSGSLSIGAGALELSYATALPIAFTSATSTLAIGGPAATPAGTLSGLVTGDVIDLLGSPITNVQVVAPNGSTPGTLVMLYNGVTIGRMITTSSFSGKNLVVTPDGQGGTFIQVVTASGGGGGTGQTGTDPLVWTGAANGNWSYGGNWLDTVTTKPATLPPGSQTAATINGPSGASFQSITGTGTCSSLLLNGNGFFFGNYTAGTLSIGQDATQAAAATPGTLVTTVLTTFTLGSCLVADGAFLAAGNKTAVDVAGTLAVSDGGLASALSFTQQATGQVGALTLGGGSVSADSFSSLEIGTLGGAAIGKITIDTGAVASGYGSFNLLGNTVDNGTLLASGGTLVVGPITGTGRMQIATEATLAITSPTAENIAMIGAGATLDLVNDAAAASGVIGGFLPGDSIITADTVIDTVTYTPGGGAVGTLTLSEAGQTVANLLLLGNYAGDSFTVKPDGAGSVILVTAPSNGGTIGTGAPPPGTVTPDQYSWTGSDGVLWADVKNWSDTTQSQTPAAVAPGQNDIITVAVPVGGAQELVGPGNAAAFTATGSVALVGNIGIGTLSVGTAQASGVLGMGAGTNISAANVSVLGGIAGQGGALSIGGTLTLGATGSAGLVSATGQTAITADTLILGGLGSQVITDSTGMVEIGGAATAAPGTVTIDDQGVLSGAGAINPAGQVVDDGALTASGGTLVLGSVSGTGTALVGVGATMVLDGAVAAGLTVDFAAGGTLTLAGDPNLFDGAIADFGPGDQILLPVSGATQAVYTLTGPGIGVLTIYAGTMILAQLTLLGSQTDFDFSVAGSAGGGTVLTATPSKTAGEGGSTMGNFPTTTSGFQIDEQQLLALAPFAQSYLVALNQAPPHNNTGVWEYFLAGDTTVVGGSPLSAIGLTGLSVEVIGPLSGYPPAGGFGPGSNMVLTPGYNALIAEGTNAINLIDQIVGNSILIGNEGADILNTLADNDTLVGATGANTVFVAAGGTNVTIVGGGNDTITSTDNSQITTSGGHSGVFLGSANNSVVSGGSDQIICAGLGIDNDTVTSLAPAGMTGDTVFGPVLGSITFNGGSTSGTVVGGGGQVVMNAGAGNNNLLWAGNSYAVYQGGSGAGIVVGGSQALVVQGGSAPTTVWGGTGPMLVEGTAGHSIFVAGFGPSTISAATGNNVYILGNAQVSVAGAAGVVAYGGLSDAGNIFQANAGSETLWGGVGNDTFDAGSGAGTFVSGGGADIFNFTNGLGGGADVISGFVQGVDTIALHGYGYVPPTMSVHAGSTYFTLSDGSTVELYNVTNANSGAFSMT